MDFDLTEEQAPAAGQRDRLLADSLLRSSSARPCARSRGATTPRPCGDAWRTWACSALPFAESDGGLGGGPVEMMIVMEAFGRRLVLEPYLATVVLAGGCLRIRRERRAAQVMAPRPHLGTDDVRVRARRTRCALRPCACDDACASRRRARGFSMARSASCCTATALTGWSYRRASQVLTATDREARAVRRRRDRRPASRVAAIRRRIDCAPPTYNSRTCASTMRTGSSARPARSPTIDAVVDEAIAASVRRGRRHDGASARDHGRLSEDAQAVRRRALAASRRCSIAPSTCSLWSNRLAAWRYSRR